MWWKCVKCGHEWKASVQNRTAGHGCPQCAKITVGNKLRAPIKGKSLADLHPEILAEWNYKKNITLSPYEVKSNSTSRVWWICNNGHEWEARISNKVRNKTRCPYCTGRKILKGHNDFATLEKDLLPEWNYAKNAKTSPDSISPYTKTKVWWICKKCGHEWEASILNRTHGHGCPKCGNANRGKAKATPKKGESFADLYPYLTIDWDFKMNGELSPYDFKPHSSKRVWWICHNCRHSWQAVINSRTSGNKCPKCHCKTSSTD